MLEKSAEARYQSAAGIAADLEHCIAELDDTGTIDPFPPGREDRSPTFSVTQQLYGRTEETRALLDAFARSAAGTSALLPVCGAPGVGKSMLVNEVHRSMVGCRGLFIEGKYDQLRMTDPLSALRQALDGLLGRLLAEPEERLGAWRSRLLDALGENGQILIDFLPAAAHVLGPQAEVIELPPTRARERFDRTLIAAIQVFADTDHPLVIFLDDLQWVDPASLRLLEGLLADPNSRALLVIGAYRDNELGASHPLLDTLRRLEDQGQALPPIRLSPLGAEDTLALVADSFERDAASVASLASVIHQKTAGNPFFMVQFLYRLADGGAVTRDPESGDWVWDLQAIAGFDAIETAVELMLTRLDEYDAQTRQLLRLAGCLGALFDLRTLSTIADRSPRDVSRGLWKPVRDGLVLPLDDAWQYYLWLGREGEDAPPPDSIRYRFAHDRVQEAALASIPEDERAEVSLRIGRLLLADADAAEREARIFDLVDHLSLGARLLQTRSERDELASLCLAAGRKARGATAFPAAREYLERGVELLGDDGWERDFALMFQFHRERIEVEFALGHLELAIEAFDVVRRRSHTLHQLGDIYQLMIRIHLTADEVVEGLRLGREVLARFGLELPAEPDAIAAIVEDERARIAGLIGDRNILDLVNEPR
jgi:histidine kinase